MNIDKKDLESKPQTEECSDLTYQEQQKLRQEIHLQQWIQAQSEKNNSEKARTAEFKVSHKNFQAIINAHEQPRAEDLLQLTYKEQQKLRQLAHARQWKQDEAIRNKTEKLRSLEIEEAQKLAKLNAEQEATNLKNKQMTDRASFFCNLHEIIEIHIKTLALKRFQLVKKDDYGFEVGTEKWERELDYFFTKAIADSNRIKNIGLYIDQTLKLEAIKIIDTISRNHAHTTKEDLAISGSLYEDECCTRLKTAGWSTIKTPTSGDHGIDIIATLGDFKIGIQCKSYSQPVGNFAVQEIFAGAKHENCPHAAVVSNASYTKAAHELANSLGVLLLHHRDLDNLHKILRL